MTIDDEDEGDSDSPFNLGDLLSQVQQMTEQLSVAQAEAADEVVEGNAGGGAVRIQVTGGLEFRSVTIDPGAIDPDDASLLEDLVLAALRDAMDQVSRLTQDAMGHMAFGAGLGDMSSLTELAGLGGLILGQPGSDEHAHTQDPDAEHPDETGDSGPASRTD
jgi:nucleoid-associated protein EbfC